MTRNQRIRGIRFGVVAAIAVAVASASLYAFAQAPKPPSGVKSLVQAQRRAEQLDVQQRLNRLIVKFKDSATANAKTSAQSVALAQDRVQALNTLSITGKGGVTLSYLKSVTSNTHVARTSQAMTHAELNAMAQTVAEDESVE